MIRLVLGFIISVLIYLFALAPLSEKQLDGYKNLMAPPVAIKYFTFGFRDAFADTFWLRLIQDMDYCGGKNVSESSQEVIPTLKCPKGWVFQMFNLITELSPDFYLAYRVGITALPILARDNDGAGLFIEKATAKYPKDWTIAYRSAYYYIYESPNIARAAELLNVAAANGAPEWVAALSAKLFDQSGQLDIGIATLAEFIKSTKDSKYKEYLEKRLRELIKKRQSLKK